MLEAGVKKFPSILVVDDDTNILKSVKILLESNDYSVDTADTGKEAKRKISSHCYDLALLDIKLPDSEGTELLKEISEESPETVKIILTGYPTLENAVESLNMGADAYILKPVNPQALLSIVKENLRKHEERKEMNLERVKKWIVNQVNNTSLGITEHEKIEGEAKGLIEILDSYNVLLEDSNKTLKQSNEELENYTYVVSHDLKAPLRAIRNFSAFLLDDYGTKIDDTGQDYLKRIVKAAENMNELIEDLLVLSRVGRKFMEVEEINLSALLEEIVSDLKPVIEKRNSEVVVNELPTISGQRIWIKQLFLNLIDNGLKFNKSDVPRVEVKCTAKEREYLFSVHDNGIGIDQQYHKRIFNLFERLNSKEEYEGTGAGLAICKKIVEDFGGKIWVESKPNNGSTFFFTILGK
jgi:two-component system sensor histidine kinase/response regulator